MRGQRPIGFVASNAQSPVVRFGWQAPGGHRAFLGSTGEATCRAGQGSCAGRVRGLAVLLVVISHAGFPLLKLGAIVGVSLFFVLSGYLITGPLLDEHSATGQIRFGRLYRHRALRLLPTLALLLVVWAPAALIVGRNGTNVAQGRLALLFYFQNLSPLTGCPPPGSATLGHCRSRSSSTCSVPAVMLLALRQGRRAFMAVAAVESLRAWRAASSGLTGTQPTGSPRLLHTSATVWPLLAGVLLVAATRMAPSLRAPTLGDCCTSRDPGG